MYLKSAVFVLLLQSFHVFAQSSKCAHLDILFLIDESQSMLVQNGFENGKSFVTNVVNAFSALPDARFSWITFNSKVWQQTTFQSAKDFVAIVQGTPFNTGSSNYELGFTAAQQSITEYSANAGTDREPVLIFFSDGRPNTGGAISDMTKEIRCDLKTKIIGLGVGEDPTGAAAIKMSIGVGATDSCVKSAYQDISNYGSVPSEGVNVVQRLLGCQGF